MHWYSPDLMRHVGQEAALGRVGTLSYHCGFLSVLNGTTQSSSALRHLCLQLLVVFAELLIQSSVVDADDMTTVKTT